MDTRKTLEEVREEIANMEEEEFWDRLRNAEDAYQVAVRLLYNGGVRELIEGEPRVIECTPVALLNTRILLEPLVERAIEEGLQNHLCYILRETRLLARKYGVEWNGDIAIKRLRRCLLPEIQTFNDHPPEKPKTNTERAARVKTWGYLFAEQYKVYGNGRPIA